MSKVLNQSELCTIANALRVAAEVYAEDASKYATHDALKEQFNHQTDEAYRLAAWLDEYDVATLEVRE